MVKTSPSSAGAEGSIPGQGAKTPQASWPRNQNTKQKLYCNKFNKDFKIVHIKKKKYLKKVIRELNFPQKVKLLCYFHFPRACFFSYKKDKSFFNLHNINFTILTLFECPITCIQFTSTVQSLPSSFSITLCPIKQ